MTLNDDGRSARTLFLATVALCFSLCAPLPAQGLRSSQTEGGGGEWECGPGSPSPRRLRGNVGEFVRFHAPFDAPGFSSRACWDASVRADLRRATSLRLDIRCADVTGVRQFTVYLRSGEGWYAAPFMPRGTGHWEAVEIRKSDMDVEGEVAGWRNISALRVAAWKGGQVPVRFDLRDIRAPAVESGIFLVRGLASEAGQSQDARSVRRYARTTAEALANAGLVVPLLEEADLDARLLADARLLVLPYNPVLGPRAAGVIREFVRRGGKLLGFYTVPGPLASMLGVTDSSFVRAADIPGGLGGVGFDAVPQGVSPVAGAPKRLAQHSWMVQRLELGDNAVPVAYWMTRAGERTKLPAVLRTPQGLWMTHVLLNEDPDGTAEAIRALVGELVPSVWPRNSFHAIRECGGRLPYGDVRGAYAGLLPLVREDSALRGQLNRAIINLRAAFRLHRQRRYSLAIRNARMADRRLETVFLATRPAPDNELRAVWSTNFSGAPTRAWPQLAAELKRAGVDAVFLLVGDGAQARYPSQVLSVASPYQTGEGREALGRAVAACRAQGVQVHAWLQALYVGRSAPASLVQALERNGELAEPGEQGGARWLVPSHPAVRARLLRTVVELLETYPLDGIHLDYIRYGASAHDRSETTRRAFEQVAGPGVPRRGGQWKAFRRREISRLVRDVHAVVKRTRPQAVLSAAVFGDLHVAAEAVAQDWPRWCREGWVDWICPMNYEDNAAAFRDRTARQVAALRGLSVRLLPGIGVTPRSLDNLETVRQIQLARQVGTPGFALYKLDAARVQNLLPILQNWENQ